MRLPPFLQDILTTKDGVSFDPIRVGLIAGTVVLLGLAVFDVVANKQHFNALEYGGGLAALFAGAGAGIGAKRKDEPEA